MKTNKQITGLFSIILVILLLFAISFAMSRTAINVKPVDSNNVTSNTPTQPDSNAPTQSDSKAPTQSDSNAHTQSDSNEHTTKQTDGGSAITTANAIFTVGELEFLAVEATEYPASGFSTTSTLPSGITFDPTTGILSGTPIVGSGGIYPITIRTFNEGGSYITQVFILTVNEAPAINSGSSINFTAGTGGSFTITTSGYPSPSITKTGTLPSGVSFTDNGDGTATLSVSNATNAGTSSLSFTASNGIGAVNTQNFTLTVGTVPAITSNTSFTCTEGTGGSFTITTSGYPSPSITKTGTLPSGVSFTDNGDGTATLSVSPAANAGTSSLSFTSSNGIGAVNTQSFTLTVGAAPAAPVLLSAYTDSVGYIYLEFSEPMAAPPLNAGMYFTVHQEDLKWGYSTQNLSIGSVFLMSGHSDVIVMLVIPLIVEGAVVMVSYTPLLTESDMIKSVDSVYVQSFGPINVTNNSTINGDQ